MPYSEIAESESRRVEESKYSLFLLNQRCDYSGLTVKLGSEKLTIGAIAAVARSLVRIDFSEADDVVDRISRCHQVMMKNVNEGTPVYGCNTGYGAQAAKLLTNGTEFARQWCARSISEAIAAIDVAVGPPFAIDVVRAGMLVRINMLLGGVSGVKLADLELLRSLLNSRLTPVVNQFGGIGASGDLAQNSRIVSVLRQLQGTEVIDANGHVADGPQTLQLHGLLPLQLDPKAGLGLCNGDNFSTAAAALLAVDTLRVLTACVVTSAMVVEVLQGSNRMFHPMLAELRPHPGQQEVATVVRLLLQGSQLAFQELDGPKPRREGTSVQDGYSLRGIAQFLAVSVERVADAFDIIERNANSVSDNPLWVPPERAMPSETPWQWISGANFLAMHMAEVIDGLRKTLTHVVKLCDRHLARMVNPHLNNGLTANLADPLAVTHCTFKGVQIQAGMFDVYSQMLSQPVTTMFGIHEEGNQDITSHALTSAILGFQNLQLARYAVVQNLIAVAQAVDLRGGRQLLAPQTSSVYDFVRSKVDYVSHEQPMHRQIQAIYVAQETGELAHVINRVLQELPQ